jgi:dimethylargininase
MFKKAIVRRPGKSMVNGLTKAGLGVPDHGKALLQHDAYVSALKECGLEVVVLPADEHYPDSTFIEDTALLTPKCAIITNPGALSRRGESAGIKKVLSDFYSDIEKIREPGKVDGGDIMMVGNHFYIGLSERTNKDGARQLIGHLEKYSMSGSTVRMGKLLHLKTGVSYLERNNLVASGEFQASAEFKKFNILKIDQDESYAANCIWVNDQVVVPKGYPKAKGTIESAGYKTIEVDVSEFRKLDGGLSCLSLRF